MTSDQKIMSKEVSKLTISLLRDTGQAATGEVVALSVLKESGQFAKGEVPDFNLGYDKALKLLFGRTPGFIRGIDVFEVLGNIEQLQKIDQPMILKSEVYPLYTGNFEMSLEKGKNNELKVILTEATSVTANVTENQVTGIKAYVKRLRAYFLPTVSPKVHVTISDAYDFNEALFQSLRFDRKNSVIIEPISKEEKYLLPVVPDKVAIENDKYKRYLSEIGDLQKASYTLEPGQRFEYREVKPQVPFFGMSHSERIIVDASGNFVKDAPDDLYIRVKKTIL